VVCRCASARCGARTRSARGENQCCWCARMLPVQEGQGEALHMCVICSTPCGVLQITRIRALQNSFASRTFSALIILEGGPQTLFSLPSAHRPVPCSLCPLRGTRSAPSGCPPHGCPLPPALPWCPCGVPDDMELSPDFFDFFEATSDLLDVDT